MRKENLERLIDEYMCCFVDENGESLPRRYPRRFIGAMPFNITRVAFQEMREKEYYVSEKTDGVRYMLLITADGAFLVTRKFDFLFIEGSGILVRYFAINGIPISFYFNFSFFLSSSSFFYFSPFLPLFFYSFISYVFPLPF